MACKAESRGSAYSPLSLLFFSVLQAPGSTSLRLLHAVVNGAVVVLALVFNCRPARYELTAVDSHYKRSWPSHWQLPTFTLFWPLLIDGLVMMWMWVAAAFPLRTRSRTTSQSLFTKARMQRDSAYYRRPKLRDAMVSSCVVLVQGTCLALKKERSILSCLRLNRELCTPCDTSRQACYFVGPAALLGSKHGRIQTSSSSAL